MNTYSERKILACVDHSAYADAVTDAAAWASQRTAAPLELLQVIDRPQAPSPVQDHSGAIGFDAQEALLDALTASDEAHARSAKEAGRALLQRLRQRAIEAGATAVDMRLRHGSLAETLAERQHGLRLVVMGRRGESASGTRRDLGRQVEHTVRTLRTPILLTTEHFAAPQRALFAFDGQVNTRRGVELLADSPWLHGVPIHLLMVSPADQEPPKPLAWALERLRGAGLTVSSELRRGDPEQAIAQAIGEQQAGLLIMGAYSHSPWRSLLLGSKTNDLLRASPVPTLLLR